jgi:hypothetical protein
MDKHQTTHSHKSETHDKAADNNPGHKISQELQQHHFAGAHHDLMTELHKHPDKFHGLVKNINQDLVKHHQSPLHVEQQIVHIDFQHHDIFYSKHQSKTEEKYSAIHLSPHELKQKSEFQQLWDHMAASVRHEIHQITSESAHKAQHVAQHLDTRGNCAKGPRLVYGHFGYHLPPVVATEQGDKIAHSHLFMHVPRSMVAPGDYGVREWRPQIVAAHGGINKGDAFIVTKVKADGHLRGANDHEFDVPEDGGRYKNLQFYRPNAKFVKLYG